MICSWRLQVNYSVRVPVCGEVFKFIIITQLLIGNKFIRAIYTWGGEEALGR